MGVGRCRGLFSATPAGRRSENRRQPDRHRRFLVWWRGHASCRLRATARRARAGTRSVCHPRLLLSGGRLWCRSGAWGLYGRADPDAIGREGRQPAGRKGRGVSHLRQKRGCRAAYRRLDLSGSVSRLDGSQPGRSALLSAIPQHAKMSVPSAGAIPACSPHQRPGSADGSQCHAVLSKGRSGLHHGLR